MRYLNYGLIALLLLCSSLLAQEKVTLNAPVGASAGVADFRPGDIHLSLIRKSLEVVFYEVDNTGAFVLEGKQVVCVWTQTDGSVGLLQLLTKANLAANSLQKRIMQRAQTRGCLGAGAISGTPE